MDVARQGSGERISRIVHQAGGAAAPALARLLRDRGEPAELRAAAAVALGRRTGSDEAALIEGLRDPAPEVVRRSAEALGRVGEVDAESILATTPVPPDPAAARAVRFARLLHAARHNLARSTEAIPRHAPAHFSETSAASLEPAPPSAEQLAQLRDVAEEELPGVPIAAAGAVALTCGKNRFLVVPHARLGAGEQGVPAIVLKRAQSLDRYALFLYILAERHSEGRLRLTAWRSDGSLAGEGEALLGERTRFSLHALDTLHLPPIEIAGTATRGALHFDVARVAAPVKEGQRTRTPARG